MTDAAEAAPRPLEPSIGRVLVIGAAGNLGRPVLRALALRPGGVRAMTRDPDKARALLGDVEVAKGDVTDRASLRAALDGCEGVHLNLRSPSVEAMQETEVEGAAAVAEAAVAQGVRRLTYLSNAGLDAALAATDPFIAAKLRAEAAILGSGVPYTLFRATHFMESLPMFAQAGRADVIGRQPARYHYLAAEDYAAMVARAYDAPAAAGKAFDVFGPETFTMREALQRYLDAARPGMKAGVLPLPMARVIAAATRNAGLRHAVRLFSSFQRLGESGDPAEANALLGAPTTTLGAWCARQAVRA